MCQSEPWLFHKLRGVLTYLHRNKGVEGDHWSAISVTGPGLMQDFHIKGVL